MEKDLSACWALSLQVFYERSPLRKASAAFLIIQSFPGGLAWDVRALKVSRRSSSPLVSRTSRQE